MPERNAVAAPFAFPSDYKPEFDSLSELLIEMGSVRSVDSLLKLIVNRLNRRPHIALVRIWLKSAGDICGACPMQDKCSDRTACLHLVASAGKSALRPEADWSRIDGSLRRFPLGVGKIGWMARTGEGVGASDFRRDRDWADYLDWIERENIRGFAGQPMVHNNEVLGVLALFLRIPPDPDGFRWLKVIGNHAAAAMVNARAFEQIEQLKARLELENSYLREEVREVQSFGDIIGSGPATQSLIGQIELVAPTEASVLITGESGTGKELVAREIHGRSRRSDRPLIRVNCAGIPRELFESEFFGHVKGSFTGAVADRIGRFALAEGGTLFLDEVGEIPLDMQAKLLRVLQEKEYERVGGSRTRRADVRVIAASNRNLAEAVRQGRFRADLYYRLNVFPIEVAPLRERPEDIPQLAAHFLEQNRRKARRPELQLTEASVIRLRSYSWPGNVRQLQNCIERAAITAGPDGRLRFDLPDEVDALEETGTPVGRRVFTEAELRALERDNTRAALRATGWRVHGASGAASLLGVNPTTLASRIKKWGIRRGNGQSPP